MRVRAMFITVVLASLTQLACAVQVTGLYEGRVAVADQTAAARAGGIRDAMRQVIVKLTGRGAAADSSTGKALVRDAERYVQQYQYAVDSAAPVLLVVAFDAAAIDAALEAGGLARWSANRPSTSLWLAVESNSGLALVGQDEAPSAMSAVAAAAQARAVPVLVPLLDLEDLTLVNAETVRAREGRTLLAASRRYGAASALAVVARERDGAYQADFTLFAGAQPASWQASGRTLEEVLAAGVGRLADRIADAARAAVDAPTPDVAAVVEVRVRGVASFGDYVRVQRYLATLDGVDGAVIGSVAANEASFRVRTRVPAASLLQSLASAAVLRPDPGSTPGVFDLLPALP